MTDVIQLKQKKKGFWAKQKENFRKNKSILWFLLPAIFLVLLFGYVPMLGVVFAFKEDVTAFNWLYDVLVQPFTFKHIIRIFENQKIILALTNTLSISVAKILICFPLTIIFAILLSEIKNQTISKLILIILCLPNFLSWPVTIGIWNNLLSIDDGLINNIIVGLGGEPVNFFKLYFKELVVFLSIWKGLGWGSIFFYSAIMSIDKEYYEAATIDGANKIQKVWYLTIPGILPVIALQLVLNITYILDAGFDQVYTMLQFIPTETYKEQILGTYIFDLAMAANIDIPLGVATSVMNGVFSLVLMLVGNYFVKKKLGTSLW